MTHWKKGPAQYCRSGSFGSTYLLFTDPDLSLKIWPDGLSLTVYNSYRYVCSRIFHYLFKGYDIFVGSGCWEWNRITQITISNCCKPYFIFCTSQTSRRQLILEETAQLCTIGESTRTYLLGILFCIENNWWQSTKTSTGRENHIISYEDHCATPVPQGSPDSFRWGQRFVFLSHCLRIPA